MFQKYEVLQLVWTQKTCSAHFTLSRMEAPTWSSCRLPPDASLSASGILPPLLPRMGCLGVVCLQHLSIQDNTNYCLLILFITTNWRTAVTAFCTYVTRPYKGWLHAPGLRVTALCHAVHSSNIMIIRVPCHVWRRRSRTSNLLCLLLPISTKSILLAQRYSDL